MNKDVPILVSFLAGIASFISPCVLPIVPGYLSFISGVGTEEMRTAEDKARVSRRVLLSAFVFVLGFSTVFVALGASATFVGSFLRTHLRLISQIAGVLIIIFGLHMTGIFKINFLTYEKRFHQKDQPASLLGAYLVGLAFAFGWTPCIGPILASILSMAAFEKTLWRGVLLLAVYSLGLGIPFLLAAMGLNTFYSFFKGFKKHLHTVEVVSGALMILAGILILTGSLTRLAGIFSRWIPSNLG